MWIVTYLTMKLILDYFLQILQINLRIKHILLIIVSLLFLLAMG